MTKILKRETQFEKAFRDLTLATWNRQRTTTELRSFLARREQIVEDVEL